MQRFLWWMFFLFLLLVGFTVTTYFVLNGKVLPQDQYIIDLIKQLEAPFVTKVMFFISHIGSKGPVIVISLIFLLIIYMLYRQLHEVVLFIIVSLGSTGLNQAMKFVLKRDRPLEQIITESGFSYPSGHTMAAVSLYGIITFLLWRHTKTVLGRILLIFFSSIMMIVIGFSRIYLRVHYPSDVLGAFLLSGIWLYITIWVYQYVMEKRYEREKKIEY
jgi:undecaprenyl-diphosphatase